MDWWTNNIQLTDWIESGGKGCYDFQVSIFSKSDMDETSIKIMFTYLKGWIQNNNRFKINYKNASNLLLMDEGCDEKIWRTIQISSMVHYIIIIISVSAKKDEHANWLWKRGSKSRLTDWLSKKNTHPKSLSSLH